MDIVSVIGVLIPIIAILVVGLLLLVPIAGLTARFALKPAIEAYARLRASHGQEMISGVVEQRLAMMERQIENLEATIRHLEDLREIQQLRDATPTGVRSAAQPLQAVDTEQ